MPEFKKSHSTPNSDQSASLYIPRRRNGSCACFFTAFAHSKYYCREKERLSVPEPDKAEADVYIDLKCGRIVPKTNFNSSIGNKPASYEGELQETENRKYDLLKAIQDTQRGLVTTADQRSCIEEALVCVEGYDAGSFIDMGKLNGTWRLQYTSAPDVLLLLDAATKLPFFQVGQIFQTFECQGQNNGGYVRNVVSWSIPNLLEEQEGATLLVSAKFSVLSLRSIYLQFEELYLTDNHQEHIYQ